MTARFLADAVLVAHGLFVAFALLGAGLAFRWRWAPVLHLPALAWAAWVELSHGICPLTTLENTFRHQAGEAGYESSFVQHYLVPILYPPGISSDDQVWLALGLLGVNALLYGLWVLRRWTATSRWNHNLHYHPRILAAAPAACAQALDVGCGEGTLTRELRSVAREVVGIDLDGASIERARAEGAPGVSYLEDDFLEYPFEPGSFDLVASVAALHHMDAEEALTRMAELVRPGGVLVVVGLARSRSATDLAFDVAGSFATRFHRFVLGRRYWEHDAPKVWPPPLTFRELRRRAERLLPGVAYHRHLLWRFSLVWVRPGERAACTKPNGT